MSTTTNNSSEIIQKSGWLIKQGHEWKTWKKRFCRLNNSFSAPNTFILFYFTQPHESELKGQINLADVISIKENDFSKNRQNTFSLMTKARTYYFEAISQSEHDDWVSVLRKCWNRAHGVVSNSNVTSSSQSSIQPIVNQPTLIGSSPQNQSEVLQNVLNVEIENQTNKPMQLIDQAINGTWYKTPDTFIQPFSSITLSTDKAGFVVYRFILPKENINLGVNAVKYSWSQAGFENKRTYVVEKKEGFENFRFEVHQIVFEHQNLVKWRNVEQVLTQPIPPIPEIPSIPDFSNTNTQTAPTPSERKNSLGDQSSKGDPSQLTIAEKKFLADLQQKADADLPKIENSVGLNNYYHFAQQLWEQAQIAKKSGDVESAYVLLYKYSTFVVDKLPFHVSYNSTRFADDKASARAKCKKVFSDMETLQAKLLDSKRYELMLDQLPTVPGQQSSNRK